MQEITYCAKDAKSIYTGMKFRNKNYSERPGTDTPIDTQRT